MEEGKAQIIQQAVKVAGNAVQGAIPDDGVVEKEGRANILTAADLASEKLIIEHIQANYPDDLILSEETNSNITEPLRVNCLWVIDPIDGTSNFRFQRNYSAISVGYVENGAIQLGAVYDPFRDELFFAKRGEGAFLNGKRIQVNDTDCLSKATVATDNSYDPAGTRHNIELLLKLNPSPWVLIKGSAVLTMCEVASGRIDIYFHTFLKPWDNAASFLIAEEAGASIFTLKGKETTFLSEDAVVGNKKLVEQFLGQIAS